MFYASKALEFTIQAVLLVTGYGPAFQNDDQEDDQEKQSLGGKNPFLEENQKLCNSLQWVKKNKPYISYASDIIDKAYELPDISLQEMFINELDKYIPKETRCILRLLGYWSIPLSILSQDCEEYSQEIIVTGEYKLHGSAAQMETDIKALILPNKDGCDAIIRLQEKLGVDITDTMISFFAKPLTACEKQYDIYREKRSKLIEQALVDEMGLNKNDEASELRI